MNPQYLPRQWVIEEAISTSSDRYWPTVWRRLRKDSQAMISLTLLILLVLSVLLGPLLWPVSPSQQYLNQISQGPQGATTARIVETGRLWPSHDQPLPPVDSLQALDAHTEGVQLVWPAVEGALRYQLYRRDSQSAASSSGLPLASFTPPQRAYEDRLNLRPEPFVYQVDALDETDQVLASWQLSVTPELALSRYSADLADLPEAEVLALPAHPLGTDHLGRDMLARLLAGGQTSLFIGLVAPLAYILIGVVYGAASALLGGRVDAIMMSVVDFVIALPFLLFMILFRVAVGTEPGDSGITAMLVALIALGWPSPARLVRGEILKLREMPYVEASRLMGARKRHLILRHLLPNIMGSVLVTFTFAIPSAIFTEAFLSFIGLGVVPPSPSWGSMCNDGLARLLTQPHIMLFPALAISLTVLIFNLLGDSLRDAMALEEKP